MSIVLRTIPATIEELVRLAHRLERSPLVDAFGRGLRITIERVTPIRSVQQNALMWALIGDIVNQVQWPVDGVMEWLEPEEWKEILTAGLTKTQRVASGIEGGFVMLGKRTSRMSKKEMSELLEFIFYFGANRGVAWSLDTQAKKAKEAARQRGIDRAPFDGEYRRLPDSSKALTAAAQPQPTTGATPA